MHQRGGTLFDFLANKNLFKYFLFSLVFEKRKCAADFHIILWKMFDLACLGEIMILKY